MTMSLIIYAQNKQNENEKITLCQADGFWGLWFRLCNCRHVDSDPYKRYLLREVWQEFSDIMEEKIDLIRTADLFYDLEKRGHELTTQQQKCIDDYKEWHGDTFECTSILGYDVDAASLIRWHENKDEVWKYLYNNDYHVIITIRVID